MQSAEIAFPMPKVHPVSPSMPVPFSEPAQASSEPHYLGSPIITDSVPLRLPGYDPAKDVESIYNATHGPGTNNSKLIKAFVGKTTKEIQVLQAAYQIKTQKDLVARVIDETSKGFQVGMTMLASGAIGGDAYIIQLAKGLDNHLKLEILTDLIIGRTREELDLLRAYIHATQFDDLDQIVIDATQSTGSFVQHLFTQALRVAHHNGCYDPVRDYEVLEENIGAGANDIHCNAIVPRILDRPASHVHQLDLMWRQSHFNKALTDAISLHFASRPEASEILRNVLRASEIRGGRLDYGILRDAERLNDAIHAKNHLLITIRIVRAQWDPQRFRQIIAVVDGLRHKDGTTRHRVLETVGPVFSRPLHKLLEQILDTVSS